MMMFNKGMIINPTTIVLSAPEIKELAYDLVCGDEYTQHEMFKDYESYLGIILIDLSEYFLELIAVMRSDDDPSLLGRIYRAVDTVMRSRIQAFVLDFESERDIDVCRDTAYNVMHYSIVSIFTRVLKSLMYTSPYMDTPSDVSFSTNEHLDLHIEFAYTRDDGQKLLEKIYR